MVHAKDSRERRVSADLLMFNAVIGVLESASRWQTVLRLLRCMVLEMLPPDTVTYNAVGSACEKSTMWESTLWCLRAGSIQPDMITWTSAIGACSTSCASCRWKRMLTLIRDAATGHLQPSLLICEKVVSTLWQSGKLAQMQFHLPRACSTRQAFELLRGEAVSHVVCARRGKTCMMKKLRLGTSRDCIVGSSGMSVEGSGSPRLFPLPQYISIPCDDMPEPSLLAESTWRRSGAHRQIPWVSRLQSSVWKLSREAITQPGPGHYPLIRQQPRF